MEGRLGDPFPVLKTARLTLRQVHEGDLLPLLRTMQDKDVLRYYGMPRFETEQDARDEIAWFEWLWAENQGIRWVIAAAGSDDYVGDIGFFRYKPEHARAEVGGKLIRACWRQGLMTEAMAAVVAYGLGEMGLNRIEALVDPRNPAMVRVLEKLGFAIEGTLREYEIEHGVPVDLYMLSLLKQEWRGLPVGAVREPPRVNKRTLPDIGKEQE
jgi:ribosomal-protein-alanine N-acetyltransferase